MRVKAEDTAPTAQSIFEIGCSSLESGYRWVPVWQFAGNRVLTLCKGGRIRPTPSKRSEAYGSLPRSRIKGRYALTLQYRLARSEHLRYIRELATARNFETRNSRLET